MNITPAQRVAAEVRAELARQHRTQRDVAKVLGLSEPAVSRRMRGDIPFDVTELASLAEHLGVPVQGFWATAGAA